MENELEKSIKYVLQYCKEHGVYAYNDYMERSFNDSLLRVLKFQKELEKGEHEEKE